VAISRIFEQARQTPGKIALVSNGVSFSYGDFARLVEGFRQALGRQMLPTNSLAVVDVDDPLDAWSIGLALRGLGLTTVALREAEELSTLGLGSISCVVTSEADTRPASPESSVANLWRAICVPRDFRLSAMQGPVPDIPATTAIPAGHILLTSGTTGTYKKILRDATMEALGIPLHAEINGISDQSVVYVANFGLWTAGGYRWPLITWSVGGTVVFHQEMDLHSPLAQHDMTHIFTTPAALEALLDGSKGALRRNDTTRLMVTGGALSRVTMERAKRLLTQQVYSVLASTEALTVAITPLNQPDDLLWHSIHPSREVQVVDEADKVLGPWQEGLVRIRIIDGLRGYYDDDTATRAFFHDGYFYPGDVGMLGDDGRLSLRGRASDVVNVLGDKVATGPIERALQEKLGVTEVCIISAKDAEGGDEIFIVVQSVKSPGHAEVQSALSSELGALKRLPVRVVVVERLPRNDMGKVKRVELRRQLSEVMHGNALH
jgi:acyl-coenzyme A synthetase/AMP-(fatty) acid ligase